MASMVEAQIAFYEAYALGLVSQMRNDVCAPIPLRSVIVGRGPYKDARGAGYDAGNTLHPCGENPYSHLQASWEAWEKLHE